MTTEQLYELFLQNPSAQTDTRKLQKGDLFFALSGPNFNGNDFAIKAIEKGAAYAIVDEKITDANAQIIQVENVLNSLQLLAKYHREQFDIPFIAITGSNGKTTTKELVNVVLSSHYKTYTTQGNLNNHIGVPLTLLSIKPDAEMAVIEMGANHQKEIEGYCQYAEPGFGIITNVGRAHLEGFGSLEGVKKGKGELFDYLRANDGTAFIFKDYDYLEDMSRGIKNIVTYGTSDAFVSGQAVPGSPLLQVQIAGGENEQVIHTKLVGDYNLANVLCSVAVGKYFQVPFEKITRALEDYVPGNSRSQMVVKGSNHIILDAYNANPSSMKAAIENLANLQADNKVLFLGAMMELGAKSQQEHNQLLELIDKYKWSKVVLVGGDFGKVAHSHLYFNTSAEAAAFAVQQQFESAHILVKGSRSMQMERLLESFDAS